MVVLMNPPLLWVRGHISSVAGRDSAQGPSVAHLMLKEREQSPLLSVYRTGGS